MRRRCHRYRIARTGLDEGPDLATEPMSELAEDALSDSEQDVPSDVGNDLLEVSEEIFFDIPRPIDNGSPDEGVNNCLEAGTACYLLAKGHAVREGSLFASRMEAERNATRYRARPRPKNVI